MLKRTRDLLLMYLGIAIGLTVSALIAFFLIGDHITWQVKIFLLLLAGISCSIFAYFHRPK